MAYHKETELLPDLTLRFGEKRLVVASKVPMRAVSSAILMGGLQPEVRCILNMTVDKGYNCRDPVADLKHEVDKLGLPPQTVGMMTAVDVSKATVAIETAYTNDSGGSIGTGCDSLRVAAIVTAGISNAWRVGTWPSYLGQSLPSDLNPYPPGTVNIIVLVDGGLAEAAMVNAVMTGTEAKTAVFHERNIRCRQSGAIATGTTTDAVVVACTDRGEQLQYAGPGTVAGTLIARAVSKALHQALDIWEEER
ncbi:adenosylcobinamide amidohydrolase [Effusibacillus lacus]|uniref:Adenosylcobinamide amidohydrolase n=1 Tax=Effusibacillus lacus TaxID=1348429 RepID=A0A292YLJ8_9BACL|nr:adenosylcobinamide amidohydrolase [Effusibacillus lacus]TCS70838.1 adenosylcobinamide amidohydrolase [Effusibacillus lacus]GAX89365.1 hypothetical protein EFBL_0983 [Effusibacillus lacus]